MEDFETIIYREDASVARITLNRPKQLNALNETMRQELLNALRQATRSDAVRVIVLAAEGKSFCAGADLREVPPETQWVEDRINAEFKPFLMAIENAPKPVVASVRGAAAGIGGALMMACDLAVMSENAYVYQAFAAIGLIPDGGASWHLARALGPKRAYEIMMSGERLQASACLDLGLVNRVVPDDQLETATAEIVTMLLSKAPLSMRYTKEAIRRGTTLTLSEAISLEAQLQNVPRDSADYKEGKAAFLEKRKPVWSGE